MERKIKRNKVWTQLYVADDAAEAAVQEIADSLGLTRQAAKVLYNRGCADSVAARAFL